MQPTGACDLCPGRAGATRAALHGHDAGRGVEMPALRHLRAWRTTRLWSGGRRADRVAREGAPRSVRAAAARRRTVDPGGHPRAARGRGYQVRDVADVLAAV